MRVAARAAALFALSLAFSCSAPPPLPEVAQPAPPPAAPPAPTAAPAQPVGHAPKAPVPLEEYFKVRRVGGASFSHDEKLVAYMSDEGGRMDVWAQPVGGGKAYQLTHVSGFVHSFAFSPTQDVAAYETDTGGDELPHLFLTDSKGTAPRDIVADYPKGARTEFVRWADDGKTLLFLSNVRDQQYLDLYEYSLDKKKAERLWDASKNLAFAITSRDHRVFVIQETLSDADSNLYLVERGKKEQTLLTPHKDEVLYEAATFSKDGKTLFYTADAGREFRGLYSIEPATAKKGPPTVKAVSEQEWDVDSADFSKTFKYLVTNTNIDGTPKVVVSDAKTGAEVKLPASDIQGPLVPSRFSKSDRYLGATLITDGNPSAVYVIDLKENKATRLTDPLPEALRARPLVTGESVRVNSFDGRKVPAFVYRPSAGAGPFPAVIDVHGGPTSQSRRRFDPLRQYLVSKGYVVMVPNVRGSTGYGKTFTKLDNLDLGGGPLQDVVACKKWLVTEAKVDPNKVVVLGGSYGGYMALAAATFTPTEFAAHVDYFGVSDLKSLVESFPPYWASFATYIYKKFGYSKNPEHTKYQRERSPLNFVDRIQRPLLVVQGENDARVKKDQSDRIVKGLQGRKVPVHYLVLLGEGHGFSKNDNRLMAYRATDRFLDRYLWNDTSVTVIEGPGRAHAQVSGAHDVAMALHVDIVALHLRETFTTSHGSSDVRRNVIVRCVDDGGRVGFGEAAPYYGESADAVADSLREVAREPAALGAVAAHLSTWIERHHAPHVDSSALRGPARSALESALLDLEGQRRGCSVAALLGGDPEARIETTLTLGRAQPQEMAERARRASAWRLLKVKVGGPDDEACLAAVRAAAPAVRIRADANGGWSADEALERVRMLAAHGVELIEQPIAPGDVDAIARLTEQSPIPIWVDESVRSAADVARHARAVTGVVLKLGKCGGVQGTLACIAAARAASIQVMIGCMVESSVGITAGAHIASLCELADLDGNLLLRDDPYLGVQVEDGRLVLPNRPGLGVRVRDFAS